MKPTKNIIQLGRKLFRAFPLAILLLVLACNSDDLSDQIIGAEELKLSATGTEMVLEPAMYQQKFKFSWTTGNSHGTSSAIFYKLQLDKAGNDFASALEYDLGKNIFSHEMTIPDLNDMLLNTFGGEAGTPLAMQARIIATFGNASVETQMHTLDLLLTPYNPLTSTLYMVGSAAPSGWDIANATQMEQSETNPMEFTYSGALSSGEYKFAVNTETCWCQDFYTRDPEDESKMVYNIGGSGDDIKWTLADGGMYKVTVNILELTHTIEELEQPMFNQLWIVGDASPSGWNIDTPEPFTQTSNPFVFTYEGYFTPGTFKILAGATGDWCGQWYRPLVDNQVLTETTVEQNSGCEVDNKWQVTEATEGRYKITLDTANDVIHITPVEVYLIGNATPNGWNMGSFVPMEKNGNVYTYTGPLTEGEFKFTKFNTNWCEGTEIIAATPNQSIIDTNFLYRDNCEGDDNKWLVSAMQAGNYTIVIDLENNTLTIN